MQSQLSIHLLGQRQVSWEDQPLPFKVLPRTPSLFAFLLLNRHTPLSRDSLAFTLWPTAEESKAKANLRRHLYDLRRALPATPDNTPWVVRQGQTIQWNPAGNYHLDITTFEQLSQTPHTLAQAITHYTGDLAPDIYDEWITFERDKLRNQYFATLTQLIQHHQTRQEFQAALNYIQRILHEDPWREDIVRQKIRLLQALGDRPGAIQTYEQFSTELTQELGIQPMPETQALHQTILTNTQPRQTPAGQTPPPPTYFDNFIGRTQELNHIINTLQTPTTRLLSLIGPGGIGKTRLSTTAAQQLQQTTHRFSDGCIFIPLAPVPSTDLLPIALIRGLIGDVTLSKLAPTEHLLNFLRHKSLLIILDNLEHLLDGISLIADILQAAPHVTLLITSREPLNLQAEQRLILTGLTFPPAGQTTPTHTPYDAVQLFQQASQQATLTPTLTPDQHPHIIRICQLVQGMPLALQMAGAWTRLYDCQTIADQIAAGLDILVSPLRDTPDRHRSIRAVFDHSWKLLTDLQQQILTRLAIFPSAFSLAAALAVAHAPALDMAALLDKSLLQRTPDNRYDLHQLLRQFIQEKQTPSTAIHTLLTRHQAYYFQFIQQRADGLRGGKRVKAFNEIEQVWPHIQQAWATAITQQNAPALSAALPALSYFITGRNRYEEGVVLLQMGLDGFPGREHPHLQAHLQAHLGHTHFKLSHMAQAQPLLEQSIATLHNQKPSLPLPLNHLGSLLIMQGDYTTAAQKLQQAHTLAKATHNTHQTCITLHHLGRIAYRQSNYTQAQTLLLQSQQLATANGWLTEKAYIAATLGGVLADIGNHTLAKTYYQQATTLYKILGNKAGQSTSLRGTANLVYRLGDFATAQKYNEASRTLCQEIGDILGTGIDSIALGNIAHETGYFSQALDHHTQSLLLMQDLHHKLGEAICQNNLGNVWRDLGNYPQARICYEASLTIKREIGTPAGIAATLPNLALIYTHLHAPTSQVQQLYQEALQILETHPNTEWIAGTWAIVGHIHLAQQQYPAAQTAYQRAATLRQKAQQPHRLLEPLAGLIQTALHQHNPTQAQTLTDQALTLIEQGHINTAQQPFRIYLACFQTLQANQDPRAHTLLTTAHTALTNRASHITDPLMRHMFLTKIPWHAQITTLATSH